MESVEKYRELINDYEKTVRENIEIEKLYFEKITEISDETDEKGKSKYSNAEKRQLELNNRYPDLVKDKEEIKIRLNSFPYRFVLTEKEMDIEILKEKSK